MSLDSVIYLLEVYWPYALAAGVIGLGTGWFSYSPPKPDGAATAPSPTPPSKS